MATTTFIVGAGASVEYGLPTGPALQQKIAELLRPDRSRDMMLDNRVMEIWSELHGDSPINFNTFVETCGWIATALPLSPSIDSFLETQGGKDSLVANLGKFAIARVIAESEQNSVLNERKPDQLDFVHLSSSWLGHLWKRGLRGVTADDPKNCLSDYKFITFNYDRCIERFLRLAYEYFFRRPAEEALDFIDKLEIMHVYGSLGDSGSASDFGLIQSSQQSLDVMRNIKTYSEQVDEGVTHRIASILESTERVIFLGFSFAKINTDFLGKIASPSAEQVFDPDTMTRNPVQVLGTSYQMSYWDAQAAATWADRWLRHGVGGTRLEGVTAANFFTSNSITF